MMAIAIVGPATWRAWCCAGSEIEAVAWAVGERLADGEAVTLGAVLLGGAAAIQGAGRPEGPRSGSRNPESPSPNHP